LTLKEIRITST